MKLIIQIPCFNEEESIPIAVSCLPRTVKGFESVEWLIIDDGSSDQTVRIARKCGIDHVIKHQHNKGLATAFMSGINACLELGADVIVNTDADNQYNAEDIPKLTQPILQGEAEIVIGERPISEIAHFSPLKKSLQKLGSWMVRIVSETNVKDAPSGFRAFTRDAARQLTVFNEYTYTLETIIQAGQKNISLTSVPIRTNQDLRPSKLVKSKRSYIQKSIVTMIRIFAIYRPLRFFSFISLVLLVSGISIGIRYILLLFAGDGDGHIQSLILASILTVTGFQAILFGFIADLQAANRKLLEDIRYDLRK